MHQLYLTFKTSMKEGRRAQALVGVALFTALDVILSSYASIRIIPNVLTISFASVAVAASGFFFGPWLNMLAGIITDANAGPLARLMTIEGLSGMLRSLMAG